MISYYKSKHPGLFIYIALVIISVLSFLLFEINAPQIGVLSILWGGFIFMRILSLYEVSEHFSLFTQKSHSKLDNNGSSTLAYDLLHKMSGENHMKRGLFAMHAIEPRSLLWLALGFAYVAYSFYLSQGLVSQITLVQDISIFFIIGAGFWAGQTYSYSDYASKLIFVIFTALFGVSLFTVIGSINFTDINITGGNGLIFLIAYCAVALFYSFAKGGAYVFNAIIGLLLLILMSWAGLAFDAGGFQSIALWISGWSLFSVFWVRSHCRTHKRYILYQCE